MKVRARGIGNFKNNKTSPVPLHDPAHLLRQTGNHTRIVVP